MRESTARGIKSGPVRKGRGHVSIAWSAQGVSPYQPAATWAVGEVCTLSGEVAANETVTV